MHEWRNDQLKIILNQCPVLEFNDGTQLSQSMAIVRYSARQTDLVGHDNLESAKINAVVETQRDVNDIF